MPLYLGPSQVLSPTATQQQMASSSPAAAPSLEGTPVAKKARRSGGNASTSFDIESVVEQAGSMAVARGHPGGQSLQKPILTPRGLPLDQEIKTFLTQVKRGLMTSLSDEERETLQQGRAALEVEVRLGMVVKRGSVVRAMPTLPGSGAVSLDRQEMEMCDFEFISGVSPPAFAAVKAAAPDLYPPLGKIRCPEEHTHEHVFTYAEGRRAVMTAEGSSMRWEKKLTKMDLTLQLPAAPYDMRIAANIELQEREAPATGGGPLSWESERHKRRCSWKMPRDYPPEHARHWRLDTTLVQTRKHETQVSQADDSLETTMEVELELQSGTQTQWLQEGNEETAQQMTSLLALRLTQLVDILNPSQPMSSIANPRREDRPTVAAAATKLLEELTLRRIGHARNAKNQFPGAMPLSMCRKDVPQLQQGDYVISEKTDGVRYLLVCVNDGTDTPSACLVDRSMNCFRIAGDAALAGALQIGTVLDGELVHNLTKNTAVFMVFDVLQLGREFLMELPFQDRFRKVTCEVMPACEAGTEGGKLLAESLPIVRKRFFRRTDIMSLFGFVTSGGGGGHERVYYEGEWRHHKTDGVIFQPNTPYCVGMDPSLLKWKWLDLASIDLRARRSGSSITLATEGGGGDIDMTSLVKLTEPDLMRLRADMHAMGGNIAEVALDPVTGMWVYMNLRPDKNKPNFISTVMTTLLELAEGITEQELQFRMMAQDPSQDDWSRHFAKMQKAAVKWQLDRVATNKATAGSAGQQ
jgi:hypothetical protein